MKPQHDSDLMLFVDGELDDATARALEERLPRDVSARAKVEAVGELGELVRGHLELSADAVPSKRFDALWREIDKGIDREREAAAEPAREVSRAPAAGMVRRIGRWFDRYRGHVLTGAVSAGAVAALALLLNTPGGPDGETRTVADRPIADRPIADRPPAERPPANPPVETMVTHQPAEIESLDTPGGTGTVFNLEDEDGSTTVIWVTPEDTVEGI